MNLINLAAQLVAVGTMIIAIVGMVLERTWSRGAWIVALFCYVIAAVLARKEMGRGSYRGSIADRAFILAWAVFIALDTQGPARQFKAAGYAGCVYALAIVVQIAYKSRRQLSHSSTEDEPVKSL